LKGKGKAVPPLPRKKRAFREGDAETLAGSGHHREKGAPIKEGGEKKGRWGASARSSFILLGPEGGEVLRGGGRRRHKGTVLLALLLSLSEVRRRGRKKSKGEKRGNGSFGR